MAGDPHAAAAAPLRARGRGHGRGVSAVLLAGGFSDGGVAENRFAGGWHWPAAAGALLEGLLATCVSVWALGHFRARQGRHSPPLVTALARRRILDHRGETLADADAHGGDSVASAAAA